MTPLDSASPTIHAFPMTCARDLDGDLDDEPVDRPVDGETLDHHGADGPKSHEMSSKQLFEVVFDQLCRMASAQMRSQRADHTLQTTGLVSEAYLRLTKSDAQFSGRSHYLRVASRAMRQILVDHARRRNAGTRPPDSRRVALDDFIDEIEVRTQSVTALDSAIEKLEETHPELARLVEMHVFGGQTMRACANAMGIAERTAFRRWETARTFLEQSIREDAET